MFTVRIFVDDKRLPKLLWLLDGAIVGQPEITPVRGAAAKGGKVRSTQPIPGASQPDQVAKLIFDRHFARVTPSLLKELIVEIGGKSGSYGNVLEKLRGAKYLGPKRKDGSYPVKGHNQN